MLEPTADGEEAAPTCYRHPNRETWVRCNRCERPICPDCMRDAAVGFQCPDCVREGNKSVRQHRSAFGGRVTDEGTVTKTIIGINVVVFLIQLGSARFTNRFSMMSLGVADREYYRLVTSAFLHSTSFLPHIAFNTYALLMFGPVVERTLGRSRFVVVYLLSAVGGSTLSYLLHPPVEFAEGGVVVFSAVGASGAIFGLFGAYFAIARRLRADTSQIVGLIVINLLIGFAIGFIDNWAHIGGLAVGGGVTFAIAHVPPGPRRSLVQFGAAAIVAVLLLGAVAIRTDELRHDCTGLGGALVSCRTDAAPPPR